MTNFKTESQLIREALVREIRDADRWSAVIEAWEALLTVRIKADALIQEEETLHGPYTDEERKPGK